MSWLVSPYFCRLYGVERACRIMEMPSSPLSSPKARIYPYRSARKGGPKGLWSDEGLLEKIRKFLNASPWAGEVHRKVRARLLVKGVRSSTKLTLRLMREAGIEGAPPPCLTAGRLIRTFDTVEEPLLSFLEFPERNNHEWIAYLPCRALHRQVDRHEYNQLGVQKAEGGI